MAKGKSVSQILIELEKKLRAAATGLLDDMFEDELGDLESLDDGEIEDEGDIESILDRLDIGPNIATLEKSLAHLKQYQSLLKANKVRIRNHVMDQLVECPNCNHKFNKDNL